MLGWVSPVSYTHLAVGLVGVIYVAVVISKAPEIDTSNIYSMLSHSSILYDDEGKVIDSIFGADGENRTIVEISQVPDNLQQEMCIRDRPGTSTPAGHMATQGTGCDRSFKRAVHA